MAWSADFNGKPLRVPYGLSQEVGALIPWDVKSKEIDLRETRGTHGPTAQILTAEMSLSGASSDLSDDLEKERGQKRRKEMSLSRTLTLLWCNA